MSILNLKTITIIILLAFGLIFGWYYSLNDQEEIVIVNPEYRSLTQTLDVSGSLRAHEHVRLNFPTGGRLVWVGVSEGDRVDQWQAVASLDTRQLEKQLQQDLNVFGQTFRQHDETLDEYDYYGDQGIDLSVRRLIERSQLGLDSAALQVEIRDLAVRLSSLTSPISGIVTRIDTPHAGVNINPTEIIEILNPDSLYFSILVDEVDIPLVQLDQVAQVELDALPGIKLEGSVQRISFTPSPRDPGKVSYEVVISTPELTNNPLSYRWGMQGLAELIISQKDNVLTIPHESLIFRDGLVFVELINESGQRETREIQIGIETFTHTEIIDGLLETDSVVLPERS